MGVCRILLGWGYCCLHIGLWFAIFVVCSVLGVCVVVCSGFLVGFWFGLLVGKFDLFMLFTICLLWFDFLLGWL